MSVMVIQFHSEIPEHLRLLLNFLFYQNSPLWRSDSILQIQGVQNELDKIKTHLLQAKAKIITKSLIETEDHFTDKTIARLKTTIDSINNLYDAQNNLRAVIDYPHGNTTLFWLRFFYVKESINQ
ncbi:hypothetical protein COT97_02865 [Candidatus Falkowbacteria bacterium CG10_big_fil_rev_8_21_14_0_10_39_11]|uniref:Uncharacterized protein n=1 Tax=Candidatus Falkowbacteria bacterium CG10_big_fil_rev_8_21_14_0_10_39_11 TaxID=1974565 RepID=A0A2H0V4Z3_9BACT|nr:MAG: hypothetical protein COT97_02865 [Candidatus Falkowbacteria bacterium CG10_big_fil_rev_8_21_14_0_10_39_11]